MFGVTFSWDIITGCSERSEGCRKCEWVNERVTYYPERLLEPIIHPMVRGDLIRVCPHGDFFHNQVKIDWQLSILDVINKSEADFLILTKRPCIAVRRMLMDDKPLQGFVDHPRIMIGVIAEDMDWVANRTPHLFALKVKHRFVNLNQTC